MNELVRGCNTIQKQIKKKFNHLATSELYFSKYAELLGKCSIYLFLL
jgi:hypothetical protein